MGCVEVLYSRSRLGPIYLRCCIDGRGYVSVARVLRRRGGGERVLGRARLCRAIPFLGDYCRVCAHPLPPGCRCRAHREEWEVLDKTLAVGMYYTKDVIEELTDRGMRIGNGLTSLILELKSRRLAAPLLSIAMATVLHERLFDIGVGDVDVVTYVPKHSSELKTDADTGERYNQAELLAEEVARIIGTPVKPLVIKTRPLSLSRLDIEERYRRSRSVYRISERLINEVKGLRVLLVDDVRTSGATANAIAEKLKEAGASRVYLLVAGRATFRHQFIEFVEYRYGLRSRGPKR